MRRRSDKSSITVDQIVDWALDHFERTGSWPTPLTGRVRGRPDLTWAAINGALQYGYRDLPRFGSLPRMLDQCLPEVRRATRPPDLTFAQIREWANDHLARTGRLPTAHGGPIPGTNETWTGVYSSLRRGTRGLRRKTTLLEILGKTNSDTRRWRPDLTYKQILAWAKEHFDRVGRWPSHLSGDIPSAPGERWANIHMALLHGFRGLPGGMTLSRLLGKPGTSRALRKPGLTLRMILEWADAHHARHGVWPTDKSGRVPEAPTEDWSRISGALRAAKRGLPPGWTLPQLLHKRRGAPYVVRNFTPLTERQILEWADAHYRRRGEWPTGGSGPVFNAPLEDWGRIRNSLTDGTRGLPGGSSLARLLAKHRGVPHQKEGLRPRIHPIGRYGKRPLRGTGRESAGTNRSVSEAKAPVMQMPRDPDEIRA